MASKLDTIKFYSIYVDYVYMYINFSLASQTPLFSGSRDYIFYPEHMILLFPRSVGRDR